MSRGSGRALGALALVALASPAAMAFVPFHTEDGSPLFWGVNPIHYRVADDVPPELDRSRVELNIAAAFAAWGTLPCYPLPAISDGFIVGAVFGGGDRKNTIVWVTDVVDWNSRHSATELARTTLLYRSSGEIVDADIEVNIGGFDFANGEACAPGVHDLQAALTHEVGHLFGLDHSAVAGSIMAVKSDAGDCSNRTLGQDDRDGFCATYSPFANPEPDPELVAEPFPDTVGADAVGDAGDAGGNPGHSSGGCDASGGGTALSWLFSGCALLASASRRRGRRPSPAR